jgi:hypothetical protein
VAGSLACVAALPPSPFFHLLSRLPALLTGLIVSDDMYINMQLSSKDSHNPVFPQFCFARAPSFCFHFAALQPERHNTCLSCRAAVCVRLTADLLFFLFILISVLPTPPQADSLALYCATQPWPPSVLRVSTPIFLFFYAVSYMCAGAATTRYHNA